VGKLVVLKLSGSFEQGFAVVLQLGDEGLPPSIERHGALPAEPAIPPAYDQWQQLYRQLDLPGRPLGLPKVAKPAASPQDCTAAADRLHQRCNDWLSAPAFRKLRETWLEQLSPGDGIRVLIQTDNPYVRRLPWHLWDLLERYPQAEVALSPLDFSAQPHSASLAVSQAAKPAVRILAILGDSTGIDVQRDRAVLESLAGAQITFLVEPQRPEISDLLWQQPWDILFFAGHSTTQGADQTGLIHLNPTDTLSLSQLKHALEKATQAGLQLAIFNSCDGLGLAQELAYLQLPQLIVMREPVPDRIAQEFLKYFLVCYAQGASLYAAVREARARLQAWEGQFPCATWLPILCQHPASLPPTWHDLTPQPLATPEPVLSPIPRRLRWLGLAVATLISTGIALGMRATGMMQPLELAAFDQLVRLRPKEPMDSRLLVIEITQADVLAQQAQDPQQVKLGQRSLSDRSLLQLLNRLKSLNPAVIGLDIYRDYPTSPQFAALAQQIKTHDRLIAICFRADPNADPNAAGSGVAPPPEIPTQQALSRVGFSNVLQDDDTLVRRQLLAMPPSDTCPADYAFATQLAQYYLAQRGKPLQFTADGNWQFGDVVIHSTPFPTGGYANVDGRGYQLFLNYRSPDNGSSFHSPESAVARVSLSEALSGKLPPDLVKDRIILIGTTAKSFQDYLPTPYRTEYGTPLEIPGVLLQAQMTSQLVSAVLESRPLFWGLPLWAEALWVGGWAVLGGVLSLMLKRFSILSLASASAMALLYGLCWLGLVQLGCWLAVVPSAIAYFSSAGALFLLHRWFVRPVLSTPPLPRS
jgi:CHASE2 domain-containing sensor protein